MDLKDFQQYVSGEYKIYNGHRKMYQFDNEVYVSVIFYKKGKCEVAVLIGSNIERHDWGLSKNEVLEILCESLNHSKKLKGDI